EAWVSWAGAASIRDTAGELQAMTSASAQHRMNRRCIVIGKSPLTRSRPLRALHANDSDIFLDGDARSVLARVILQGFEDAPSVSTLGETRRACMRPLFGIVGGANAQRIEANLRDG